MTSYEAGPHLTALRAIYDASLDLRSCLYNVDKDLRHEAGMDGNYQRLLQTARDLDNADADRERAK